MTERAIRSIGRGWRTWLTAVVWLLVVWLALWGALTPVLAIIGTAIALLAMLAFPLPVVDFRFGFHPLRALTLLVRLLLDLTVASFQVSWIAVRRRPPSSAITTVPLTTTSDLVQTLTALAVSLVPGSLIIDADPAGRTLTIHVLDVDPAELDTVHRRVLDQENRILLAFGDRLDGGA